MGPTHRPSGFLIWLAFFAALTLTAQVRHNELLIIPATADAATGKLCWLELRANGTARVCLKSATSLAATIEWVLPSVDGAAGECLSTNGAAVLSWAACSGGSTLPVSDATNIVKGSVDATKLLRFEVDGLTTATTRTLTPQDANYTLAGTNLAQTFTAIQTHSSAVVMDNAIPIQGKDVGGTARDLIARAADNHVYIYNDAIASGNIYFRPATAGFVVADKAMIPGGHRIEALGRSALNHWSRLFLGYGIEINSDGENPYLVFIDNGAAATKQRGALVFDPALTDAGWVFQKLSDAGAFVQNNVIISQQSARIGIGVQPTEALDVVGNIKGSGTLALTGAATMSSTLTVASAITANGGIATHSASNSTIFIGTGDLYLNTFSGADKSCTGVTDGWVGYRLDTDQIQVCDGGVVKKVALT